MSEDLWIASGLLLEQVDEEYHQGDWRPLFMPCRPRTGCARVWPGVKNLKLTEALPKKIYPCVDSARQQLMRQRVIIFVLTLDGVGDGWCRMMIHGWMDECLVTSPTVRFTQALLFCEHARTKLDWRMQLVIWSEGLKDETWTVRDEWEGMRPRESREPSDGRDSPRSLKRPEWTANMDHTIIKLTDERTTVRREERAHATEEWTSNTWGSITPWWRYLTKKSSSDTRGAVGRSRGDTWHQPDRGLIFHISIQ